MIDIESRVFTAVRSAILAQFPGIDIKGESVDVPESFPCVTIEEIANTTLARTQDESLEEHHATLGYAINVFTNTTNTKKSVAKKIANVADNAMQELMFTRTFKSPTPNVDRTIFRLTMRYEGIVGQPIEVEGVESYPMYRR